MRAVDPDRAGFAQRDGLRIGYEVFGDGEPTVLLLPTWTIIHSRFWKMQVPYLSRHFRVITFDGLGNGVSDRSTDASRYAPDAYVADAVVVLDECGADEVVAVGVSMGCQYAVRLAVTAPDRVVGVVLAGAALPLVPPSPQRAAAFERLFEPAPEHPHGWDRYNVAYWHREYRDFVEFFFRQVFSEPHSSKPIEDAVRWAMETTPDVLEAEARRPLLGSTGDAVMAGLGCPVLVVHGTDDRIQPYETGVTAASLTGGTLATMDGSGHLPNLRDPVRFNLLLREFVERVAA